MDEDKCNGRRGIPATHWTQVYLASDREREEGLKALGELVQDYRPALHQYLASRYRNLAHQEIEDWLSHFIEKKVLEGEILRIADKKNGRFRNFLLTALFHFAEDRRQHDNRIKRRPAGGVIPYEEGHDQAAHTGKANSHSGDVAWARHVLDQARQLTEAHYRKRGQVKMWLVFMEGYYVPLYDGETGPGDAELALRHGFESARKVSNTIGTVKKLFSSHLRKVIRKYVATEEQVDAEIRELIAIVSDNTEY
jgi:hypothetical protein